MSCYHSPLAPPLVALCLALSLASCSAESEQTATVILDNDFDNDSFDRKPPWTLCESYYGGAEFGRIEIGHQSDPQAVAPGLGYVLMVAAWDDPSCNPSNTLPIASRNEEEVVAGQTRTISINLPNHQGPCPPEGVEPMPRDLYDAIVAHWPDYGFLPYDQRTENPQCKD